jgi:hypothetical protein
MALLTTVQPAEEPVSLAWMKNYLRLDSGFTMDDGMISGLITAAREWCESFCERAWVFQTKRLLMDFFPGYVDFKLAGQRVSSPFVSGSNAILVGIRYAIALPWPQARSIALFQYLDQNGETQVMVEGTDFVQDLDSQPARLTPLFGAMWPVARVVANAVQVDYVTGYFGTVPVQMTDGSPIVTSSFSFLPRDVGSLISIPNALTGNKALSTSILSVDVNGIATLAASATQNSGAQTTSFGTLPHSIIHAIALLVSYWYENRDPSQMEDVPFAVKALLYPYRDLRL